MNKELTDFCRKFDATVGESHKRYAYREPMSFDQYASYSASDYYRSYINTQPYIEVTLPRHRLEELIQIERYAQSLLDSHDRAAKIIAQNTLDDVVRRQNPAVQKAYEKYKTLLELARN